MKPIFCSILLQKAILILFLQYHFLMICGAECTKTSPFHHSLKADKSTLLAFKRTITDDPKSSLANWNQTTHVCVFHGVICSGHNRHRVVKLDLTGLGLAGILPSFMSNLTQLRSLRLSYNCFHGLIPPELSSLHKLRVLGLDGNMFSGPIPGSFSSLAQLVVLLIQDNNLTGEIPSSLFSNCSLLCNVDLSMNWFHGSIPGQWSCPSLWNLNLYNNQLTGEIPFSLSNATQLLNLDVENNRLSGELPAAIVSHLPTINYLHLSYNNMVSSDGNTNLEPFFTALSNCTQLSELELAGLGLGGSLPSSIGGIGGKFKALKFMFLQENHIQGPIPPEIGRLSHLVMLNLKLNQMNGTITAEIGKLSSLTNFSASDNNFSGAIPAELGEMSNLQHLDLSNNSISGEMPEIRG